MLLGRTKDEIMRWLADNMNLKPDAPETWPVADMERALSQASDEAESDLKVYARMWLKRVGGM